MIEISNNMDAHLLSLMNLIIFLIFFMIYNYSSDLDILSPKRRMNQLKSYIFFKLRLSQNKD